MIKELMNDLDITKEDLIKRAISATCGLSVGVILDDIVAIAMPKKVTIIGKAVRKIGSLTVGALTDMAIKETVSDSVDGFIEGAKKIKEKKRQKKESIV